ncbi:MAG: GNAT family N-acetyltransferase [Microthrixaceae bacterium]
MTHNSDQNSDHDSDHDRVATTTVRLDEAMPISAYTLHVADGPTVGRADFIDARDMGGERIFFHTEVDDEFAGRGLAGLLVREALADSVRKGLTIVALCPLFSGHMKKHGDQFALDGGRFRPATDADVALVRKMIRGES